MEDVDHMSTLATWTERLNDFRVIHPILVGASIVAAAMLWLARFAFTRHREFIAFTGHMKREEEQVWPQLKRQMADNHAATMRRLDEQDHVLQLHGERIAHLEGKIPNGEIGEIKAMVTQLFERRAKPRDGSV